MDSPTSGKKPGGMFALKTSGGEKFADVMTVMAVGLPKASGSIQSSAEIVGEGKLHKMTLTAQDAPLALDTVWFMTSADLFAGVANEKTDSLKSLPTAKPVKAPMILLEWSVTSLAPLGEKALPAEKLQGVVKEVFGEGKPDGRDTFKVSATGGKAFDLTTSIKGKAIAFFVALDKAKKAE
jgi:hypothetical protein